ncbi:MAG: hypothetical protein AAF518_07810 [Spirochaetota bacterium]
MKGKAITNLCILFVLFTTIKCSSYIVFHDGHDKNSYKTEEEKKYQETLQEYNRHFTYSYTSCRKKGELIIDGSCQKAKEKYQICYVSKGGLFTKKEERKLIKLKHEMRDDSTTKLEKSLGKFTLFLVPVGLDYLTHLLHVNQRAELEVRKFYQQKTKSLSGAIEEFSKYEPGTAYWKRTKYVKKLSKLQKQLLEAERDLAEVEKVEDAKETIKKFQPVFENMENVFNIYHIDGVVTGIRKDYVIAKGYVYKSGFYDTKLIIYKPKRNFKLYDKINKKSAYYHLDIDVDLAENYPIFSPELPQSYQPHEKNYRKYRKARRYQNLVNDRDKLVKEIKSLSESSISN